MSLVDHGWICALHNVTVSGFSSSRHFRSSGCDTTLVLHQTSPTRWPLLSRPVLEPQPHPRPHWPCKLKADQVFNPANSSITITDPTQTTKTNESTHASPASFSLARNRRDISRPQCKILFSLSNLHSAAISCSGHISSGQTSTHMHAHLYAKSRCSLDHTISTVEEFRLVSPDGTSHGSIQPLPSPLSNQIS